MISFVPPEKLWQVWKNDFDNVVRELETLHVAFNESVTDRVWSLRCGFFIRQDGCNVANQTFPTSDPY